MKKINKKIIIWILILFLFSSFLNAQVRLFGKINTSQKYTNPSISLIEFETGITIDSLKDKASQDRFIQIISGISVDDEGYFEDDLKANSFYKLSTFISDFYSEDTIIFTGELKEIEINFFIKPKIYIYTEESAKQDIEKGLIKLITYDTIIYKLATQTHYTDELGFFYELIKKPDDSEFESNIYSYNLTVEQHLLEVKGDGWWRRKAFLEDSLIHLDADNYAKNNLFNLNKLQTPSSFPPKNLQRIQKAQKEFNEFFKERSKEIIKITPKFMLNKLDHSKEYHYLFVAEYWMAYHYQEMLIPLIKRITNKKEIGLKNTADLLIDERIQSGDLKFYGHGRGVQDDLFTIAGRVNYLLKKITGENFGRVSMYSTPKDLKKLQNRWTYWLLKINNKL